MILQNDHCAENQQLGNNSLLTKLSFSARLPCQLHSLRQIALQPNCRLPCHLETITIIRYRGSHPSRHAHTHIAELCGRSWEIHTHFLTEKYFMDVAWLRIYFDDVHSVSFELTNSLLFLCPSRILNGTFPYSFLSGIFHPVSLMKFILFSST